MTGNSNYSYIGTVRTPDGQTHYMRDVEARAAITAIEARVDLAEEDVETLKVAVKGGTHFIGKCLTALSDRCTTNPVRVIADGQEKTVTGKAGDFTVCEKQVGSGTVGMEYLFDGTRWTELGSTGTLGLLAYKDSASGSFTPQGSVSAPHINVSRTKSAVRQLAVSVDIETETLTFEESSLNVIVGVAATADAPVFSGQQGTVTVS